MKFRTWEVPGTKEVEEPKGQVHHHFPMTVAIFLQTVFISANQREPLHSRRRRGFAWRNR